MLRACYEPGAVTDTLPEPRSTARHAPTGCSLPTAAMIRPAIFPAISDDPVPGRVPACGPGPKVILQRTRKSAVAAVDIRCWAG